MPTPSISVIMSVYNGQQFLSKAIDSILKQTYVDFDFFIINDGSLDETPNILNEYSKKDTRITIIHQDNIGLTLSLNRLIENAKGEYIARMDADDISYSERFEQQRKMLIENPHYLATGCWFQALDEMSNPMYEKVFPNKPSLLAEYLTKGINCYAHGSVMIRRKVFDKLGILYRFQYGQDFDLWLRLSEQGNIGMVEEVLYQRRDHGHALSKSLVPQRTALMNLMLSLARERRSYGREMLEWKKEESKILKEIPQWTEKEITAHDMFLESRRLLCSGENTKARKNLALIKRDLKQFDYINVAYYISFLPSFLTAPLLRYRDKINNRRHFIREIR